MVMKRFVFSILFQSASFVIFVAVVVRVDDERLSSVAESF